MPVVDVISAVRNEEHSLPIFVERIRALTLPAGVELRMVFVEDSSSDRTLDLLRELSAQDPTIGYYSLERGFGQGPAIVFALARSRADAAILMDADCSHPPEVIPRMIELHLEGFGVVQCVRRSLASRRWYRKVATSLFQGIAGWLTRFDLSEQAIYYRLVSRPFARALVSDPRYWLFLRFPLPRARGELATLEIDTTERTTDESKYDLFRLSRLAIDAVLSLMPRSRLWLGAGLMVGAAAILVALGAWPLALPIVLVAGWTLFRFRALRSSGLLARMRARELSNVPEMPAAP